MKIAEASVIALSYAKNKLNIFTEFRVAIQVILHPSVVGIQITLLCNTEYCNYIVVQTKRFFSKLLFLFWLFFPANGFPQNLFFSLAATFVRVRDSATRHSFIGGL